LALAADVTDEALELRLFGRAGVETGHRRRLEPDWAALAHELKRPGVTMMILWEEYRAINQERYGYSRFCDLLRGVERRLTPVMRQHHIAGEKVFVDYSGKRIGIVDPATGEIHETEIFVGVLGASNLTYAESPGSECCVSPSATRPRGVHNDCVGWGMQNIVGAESLSDVEGNMCGAAMRWRRRPTAIVDPIACKQTTSVPGRSHVRPGGSRRAGPCREGEEP
jgi:hypothetical protein